MITNSLWPLLVLMVGGAAFINWAYLSPRAQAMRWLAPAVAHRPCSPCSPSFTRHTSRSPTGRPNFLNKSQVIQQLEARPTTGDAGATSLEPAVYEDPAGELSFPAFSEDGQVYWHVKTGGRRAEHRTDRGPGGGPDGGPTRADRRPDAHPIVAAVQQGRRASGACARRTRRWCIQPVTVSTAQLVTSTQRYTYDAEKGVLTITAREPSALLWRELRLRR